MAAAKRKAPPATPFKQDGKRQRVTAESRRTRETADKLRISPSHSKTFDEARGNGQHATHRRPDSSSAAAATGAKGDESNGKFKLDMSSADAHAKQRQLAKERRAAKPNADSIQRSKRIWERLRRKSHVPKEERKQLVAELFTIISGRVRDFVFKHDSVRVIQCALKYAAMAERKMIAEELQGDIRSLAESKYGKFLVAKLVVEGDQEIRDMVIPQFYGHVRRLINHPEASWIVDDIYRQVATVPQKATMLREWFSAEFTLENRGRESAKPVDHPMADLSKILEAHPEKRKPMLEHTLGMINPLIQKKMTGFTMLHDAMLQYFLALTPRSQEHADFLQLLKGDIDTDAEGGGGDLYKNLAFTKSGSKLVCLAIACGTAKDRKAILRVFRDTVELMAGDTFAKMVLVVSLDVPDDTNMTTKAIYRELLGEKIEQEAQRLDLLERLVTDLNARLPILHALAGQRKWLMTEQEQAMIAEIHNLRETTSKKDPAVRRKALVEYLSPHLLELVANRAPNLVRSSFGCQFMAETLLQAVGDKEAARAAVAALADGDPLDGESVARDPAASRMLKTLVQGGTFDPVAKSLTPVTPRLGFGGVLYPFVKSRLVEWACSESSFVVVAMLESEDVPASTKKEVKTALVNNRAALAKAAGDDGQVDHVEGRKKSRKGNAGTRLLLEKL